MTSSLKDIWGEGPCRKFILQTRRMTHVSLKNCEAKIRASDKQLYIIWGENPCQNDDLFFKPAWL